LLIAGEAPLVEVGSKTRVLRSRATYASGHCNEPFAGGKFELDGTECFAQIKSDHSAQPKFAQL
jgi:hypothetical protein